RSRSVQHSRASGRAEGIQEAHSLNVSKGMSRSTADNPFYEFEEIERVSSRTFESEQEYLTDFVKRLMGQSRGHAFLKVPGKPGRFLRLPWVKEPWISEKTRNAAMERVYSLPYYSRSSDLSEERLLGDSVPPVIDGKQLPARASAATLVSELREVNDLESEDDNFAGPEVTLTPRSTKKKKP